MILTSSDPHPVHSARLSTVIAGCTIYPAALERFNDCSQAFAMTDLFRLKKIMRNTMDDRWQQQLLSNDERELFSSFPFEKRYVEWLGGRISAKSALEKLCDSNRESKPKWASYSILPDSNGRPTLYSNNAPACSISISHSRRYGAAMVKRDSGCGIDIQYLDKKLLRLQDRFSDKDERKLAGAASPLTGLACIWTAKEAIKKCLLFDRPELFSNTRMLALDHGETDKDWTMTCAVQVGSIDRQIQVRLLCRQEYVIAFCTGEKDA